MLLSLAGRDFFTFKEFYAEFASGMNAITGESGAGKTIFLRALWAVIGFPPAWDTQEAGSVEGNFSIDESMEEKFKDLGLEIEGEQLLVTVNFTGQRTMYRLNGRMVPRQLVQSIFKDTLEIHSQHSSVGLLDSTKHYLILDHSLENEELLGKYRDLYSRYARIKKDLNSLKVEPSQLMRERDFLDFQIKEIEKADLNLDEDTLLEGRYRKHKNARTLLETFQEIENLLKDSERSAYNVLNDAFSLIGKIEGFGYSSWLKNVQAALEETEGLYAKVSEESDSLEIDDEEFAAIESRLTLIQGLKRKYGKTIEDVLLACGQYKRELAALQELERKKDDLQMLERELLEKLHSTGRRLDDIREKRAGEITRDIRGHLEDLKMRGAELRFNLEREEEPKSYGTSKVSMLVKTNPGMDYVEIGKVASGGELSRYLLALESTLKDQLNMGTIVFDEVDSGVGPRLGLVVADKLFEISSKIQTVVITHLPQIASRAVKHFAVRKVQSSLDTTSTIEELSGLERELELKEMAGQTEEARGVKWNEKN